MLQKFFNLFKTRIFKDDKKRAFLNHNRADESFKEVWV